MNIVARIGIRLSQVSNRVVPDPFILALGLTLLVLVFGLMLMVNTQPPAEAVDTILRAWLQGFGNPAGLAFALQMALVLLTGQAFAQSPAMTRLLSAAAGIPRTTAQAGALVAFITCIASLLHWGLGAIAGAITAREIGRVSRLRGQAFHYPLLGAAGYTGFAVFHGGLSGSAPLKVAEQGHFLMEQLGVLPVQQTLLSTPNIAMVVAEVFAFTVLFAVLAPQNGNAAIEPPPDDLPMAPSVERPGPVAFTIAMAAGPVPLLVLLTALTTGAITLDLNSFCLVFLFAGIAAHGDVERYIACVAAAAGPAGLILLQYPFYFAIVGMMQASGLTVLISETLIAWATPETFGAVAFLSAAALNLLIPSGGGQWAVQGPILAEAGLALGVDPATIVVAFSHGDACTNLLQPFWALPLLGLMRLRAGQIIGYSVIACGVMLVIDVVVLLLTE